MSWVMLGYFITFVLFFIMPVFLNPSLVMQLIKEVPANAPIGHDFREIVAYSSVWYHTGNAPVIWYPPFTLIFFVPFTFTSYETGYKIFIALIIIVYILVTSILPALMHRSRGASAFMTLITATGIISYGLQFELERGQWNLIAVGLVMIAIYLFYYQPKYRLAAYLAFSLAVQIKLYPAIFILVFVSDWSDWKNNIKRITGLGAVNLLALLVLGLKSIMQNISALFGLASSQALPIGAGNLSIQSFTAFILSPEVLPRKRIVLWLFQNGWLLQLLLFGFFVFCLVMIVWQAYKKNICGFNPYIFLACFIGACVIPSVSFDYKLATLPAAVAVTVPAILSFTAGRNRVFIILLTLIFSIAYSSMLYSYANKPVILQNNLPALFVILAICTILSYIGPNNIDEKLLGALDVQT